jgi:hypothetical protein
LTKRGKFMNPAQLTSTLEGMITDHQRQQTELEVNRAVDQVEGWFIGTLIPRVTEVMKAWR